MADIESVPDFLNHVASLIANGHADELDAESFTECANIVQGSAETLEQLIDQNKRLLAAYGEAHWYLDSARSICEKSLEDLKERIQKELPQGEPQDG